MRSFYSFSAGQALVEAQRCLGCHEAPCTQACPAHVNVPGFVNRFRDGNLEGASELIYRNCPLGAICGTVCPTTVLCEGACVLRALGQLPIQIGSLQAFITLHSSKPEPQQKLDERSAIAVIGAGPSGLGCAVQLNRLGHSVHVYERLPYLGGLIDRVIPIHRLSHETVSFDLQRLETSGIQFHLGKEINSREITEICQDHRAIFLGVGLGQVKSLLTPGAEAPGVVSALDYLEKARRSAIGEDSYTEKAQSVIVVGGGNVALDAAVVAKKMGAGQVIVLYRRTKQEMPGWESEYLEAVALGIEFRWLSALQKVLISEGRVAGVSVQAMRFVDQQGDGRRKVEKNPARPSYEIPCEAVILALGQTLEAGLPTRFGLAISEQGTIAKHSLVSPEGNGPIIFAAGEAVSGGSTIIHSLSQGMAAGRMIHQQLESEASR